jgi:hypothetical protein
VQQVARDKLVSLGTPVGKLTHSGKFRLTVGALDVLSRYAKHKVGGCTWLVCVRKSAVCVESCVQSVSGPSKLRVAGTFGPGVLNFLTGCSCVAVTGAVCVVLFVRVCWWDQGRPTTST